MSARQPPVLLVTLLREPKEELRSRYYFRESSTFITSTEANQTFEEWMHVLPDSRANEYTDRLVGAKGNSLLSTEERRARARAVLGSWFDVVGITERYGEVIQELTSLLRLRPEQTPLLGHERDGELDKQPWADGQLELAGELCADDIALYEWANTRGHGPHAQQPTF